jgi:hypothetical protein
MDTELVRDVARGLRYRTLDSLVGRSIEVGAIDTVEDAIVAGLGGGLPQGCRLAGPELHYRVVAVAKCGILDLRFTAPRELLLGDGVRTGVPLLRELGYLPDEMGGAPSRVGDDPLCLEMLEEDVNAGATWLLLFLKGGHPGDAARVEDAEGHVSFRVPEGYLPRPFRIVDACVTNAAGVWLWKHFYV